MYPTSGATIRADINIKVEEAMGADSMFIGTLVMPPMPVGAKSGSYPKIDIAGGELLTPNSTKRSQGGSYGEVTRKWGSDTYDCEDRGLEEAIDDAVSKDVGRFFNLEVATANWVRRNIQLDHEIRVQGAIQNATNFAATNSVTAYTEANLATMDLPADVLAAIERVLDNGVQPNAIVLSSQVLNRAKRSAKLQAWVRGSLTGETQLPINAESIARSFADHGIERVLVGRARANSAKKGASKSVAPIWNNTHIWVGRINPGATTPQDGGAGFTLVWNQEGGIFVSESYRSESRRSNMIRVRQNTTEKITDATSGTLIATQYA